MIIPDYDEFGMYTSSQDIEDFIKNLVENQGLEDDTTIFGKCVEQFGIEFSTIIEYILYGKD